MRVSFTGAQGGMTAFQKKLVRARLESIRPSCAIHGGCIGADDEFDAICAELGIPRYVFPSNKLDKRVPDAVLQSRTGSRVVIMPAEDPLKRNPKIVQAGDMLLGCPRQSVEIVRSGTWTTIRCARRLFKPIEILRPWEGH